MHTRGTTSFDRRARSGVPITLRGILAVATDAPIGITGDAPG